ncbi:hypothetical protein J7355_13480 [Endozoicomonas sp. G2_2]|uniref:hypothetical protein n=1 Tax=Endozoicomonas sp. G2_2 TaxID=2821092 RepID=UPI001ADB31F9|nr:hypothetical protein [Endozoicomonas sp. G2_2]MBO9471107.1 hypothetical protein [Endozoicomonas sp. G2_2]
MSKATTIDFIEQQFEMTQAGLFGDSIPEATKAETKARIAEIHGRPRPDWMADDAREAIQNELGSVPVGREREIVLMRRMFRQRPTVEAANLSRTFGWPIHEVQAFNANTKWDVDIAFGFFVYLHTKTEFLPYEPFVFGVGRTSWHAGIARQRLATQFEGGHLPTRVEKEIQSIIELFDKKVQVSFSWLCRKLDWPMGQKSYGMTNRSRVVSSSSRGNSAIDVQDAFEMLCKRHEQMDVFAWDRRGETLRRRRKADAQGDRSGLNRNDEAAAIVDKNHRVGPRMAELMEADEQFFFKNSGAPAVCPMSDEQRVEFYALCKMPTQSTHQGQDEVHVDAPTPDEGKCWYVIDWYPQECVISLYVQSDESLTPKLIDFWVRSVGTKTREYLPQRLRQRLHGFLYEDGPYEP